jgi:hypothetical protein
MKILFYFIMWHFGPRDMVRKLMHQTTQKVNKH